MFSAKGIVVFGLIAMAILIGLLVKLRIDKASQPASAQTYGNIAGLSVDQVKGVDHLVESHIAPTGLFTLEDQLDSLGVEVYAEDQWSAVPDPSLGIGSKIEIVRATPIKVVDAGKETEYRTWQATVGEFLAEAGIDVDDDDVVNREFSTPLGQDLEIVITRVGVTEEIETEAIDYEVIKKNDSTLEKGITQLEQTGKNGERTKKYAVRYENGVEVERQLVSNEVTVESQAEITLIGTKVLTYGSGEATWYSWKSGGAAHNTLPFGTKVRVVNLSNGKSTIVTINDRGIYGSAIIDLDTDSFAAIAPLGAGRIDVRLEKVYE
ncbi:G5 domain-containing protein [Candidatus Berkelbacteria bacterium]|nr:G5 domain-containing protein [Candidatus Berkelbacteria bacterium]